MSDRSPVIVARRVTKLYGGVPAVRDVTLEVEQGEILGLLGPNGSGKTTLLRMVTGYLSPSAGSLTVAGHDTVREPMAARRRIGYVPESVPLYSHMRVREFLTIPTLSFWTSPQTDSIRARSSRRVDSSGISPVSIPS